MLAFDKTLVDLFCKGNRQSKPKSSAIKLKKYLFFYLIKIDDSVT